MNLGNSLDSIIFFLVLGIEPRASGMWDNDPFWEPIVHKFWKFQSIASMRSSAASTVQENFAKGEPQDILGDWGGSCDWCFLVWSAIPDEWNPDMRILLCWWILLGYTAVSSLWSWMQTSPGFSVVGFLCLGGWCCSGLVSLWKEGAENGDVMWNRANLSPPRDILWLVPYTDIVLFQITNPPTGLNMNQSGPVSVRVIIIQVGNIVGVMIVNGTLVKKWAFIMLWNYSWQYPGDHKWCWGFNWDLGSIKDKHLISFWSCWPKYHVLCWNWS